MCDFDFKTSEHFPIDTAADNSGITMRIHRAETVYKGIKKCRRNKRKINFNIKLPKFDTFFKEQFDEAPAEIKNELMWAWEEIGILCDKLDNLDKLNKMDKMENFESSNLKYCNCDREDREDREDIENIEDQSDSEDTMNINKKIIKLFGP